MNQKRRKAARDNLTSQLGGHPTATTPIFLYHLVRKFY